MTDTARQPGRSFPGNLLTAAIALLVFMLLAGFSWPAAAQDLPGLGGSPDQPSEPVAKAIEADSSTQPTDAQIESRLSEIFAAVPGLSAVTVEVSNGVIILGGTVEDSDALDSAEGLAERISGAVMVVNHASRDLSIAARLKAAARGIGQRAKELAGNAPLLLLALAVVAAALFLARHANRADWLLARVSENWFVRDLLGQLLQVAITFAGVVIALMILDATAILGSLVGALGIAGLAIGFATRDTVENYIASMLLSLRQPFRREDHINVDGIEGMVSRLTPRATVLMSMEGNHIRIPNAKVYKATIVNYTRNPLRRFEFKVGVDTELDLNIPRTLAVQTIQQLDGILASPPPVCLVHELGDSSVILKMMAWIDQRETDFQKARSEAQRLVKEAFDDAGIIMPEPIYNVNLRRQRAAAPRPAKGEPGPQTAPAAASANDTAEDTTDTRSDNVIEDQVRDEQLQGTEEDLLSHHAPTE